MTKFLSQCLHLNESNKYETGVYMIYHVKYPDKYYIGSASSTKKYGGFYLRFRSHYSYLKNKNHCNSKLQHVVNKYGLAGIRFLTIETCPPELCIGMEQYYINLFQPYYNIAPIAGNTLGYKHTREHLDKVEKDFVQYDLDGNFVAKHKGIFPTCRKLGLEGSSVIACCQNKYTCSQGYIWRYLEDVLDENGNIVKSIEPYSNPQHVKIISYTLDGEFHKVYESITDAVDELGYNHGNISRNINGIQRKCGKYIFKHYTHKYPLKINPYEKYHANQQKVTIINQKTNESKKYNSFREASKSNAISRSSLMSKIKQGIKEFYHPRISKKYKVIIEDYN